ncbi:38582_t:CDS:2, partial [Gigaspora margarita]
DAIDIVLTTLNASTMPEAHRNAKRLKEIQLTEDDSKYITISYIFLSILALMQELSSSICYSVEELNEVDFETDDFAFDENIGFVDAQEEEEEGPKKRRISINTPTNTANMKHKVKNALYNTLLHYWDLSDGEVFLACLLNLRCKKLRFATLSQRHEAEAALRTKYNNTKSLYQSSTTSSNKSFSTNEDQDMREGCQIYQKS